jgi:nucleoside-diphosphate-sugar epimerase
MASSITRFNDNSLNSMIKNISMAENISEFIGKNKVGYFVFLSSPDVYGTNISGMISEKLPKNPEDHYACSKLFGEVILRECCFKNDVPLLTLRLSGVYGPKDHARSTINMLVESAILKKKIIIQGDGEDKRDYIHVKDVCEVIVKGIEKKAQGELNVATGKSLSINEIVALITLSYPQQFSVEYTPRKEIGKRRIKEMIYDTSLLKKTFPEFCPIPLEKGLELYLKEYKTY